MLLDNASDIILLPDNAIVLVRDNAVDFIVLLDNARVIISLLHNAREMLK
jgi:hypothetical protein